MLLNQCETKRKRMDKALAMRRKCAVLGGYALDKKKIEETGGSFAAAKIVRFEEGFEIV